MARLMVNRLALIERIEQRMAAERTAYENDLAAFERDNPKFLAWAAEGLNRAMTRGNLETHWSRGPTHRSDDRICHVDVNLGPVPKSLLRGIDRPSEPTTHNHERSLAVLRIASRDEISVNTDDFRSYL